MCCRLLCCCCAQCLVTQLISCTCSCTVRVRLRRTPESEALSAALKQTGMVFVGPTIMYAFMQAAGLVNDHLVSCHCRSNA